MAVNYHPGRHFNLEVIAESEKAEKFYFVAEMKIGMRTMVGNEWKSVLKNQPTLLS